MKKMLLSIGLLCGLLFAACHKEETLKDPDYLVFGFSNFSWGVQCEDYKLTSNAIFEASSACGADSLVFKTTPMSDGDFKIAKTLISNIPESLFNGKEADFPGQACGDCGGYSLEISQDGVVRKFSFGTVPGKDWPEEIRDFWSEFTGVMERLPK